MAYEVDAIINNLCEKLGTAKEVLVPEMARMCSTRHLCNAVFCVVAIIAIAMLLWHCVKIVKNHEDYSYDVVQYAELGVVLYSIAIIGFFIALWYNVYECIQWFAAPTTKTIEYVLQLL